MMTTDQLGALRRSAATVYDDQHMQRSRSAARVLVPAVRALANERGQDKMHSACAELAAMSASCWERNHGDLGRLCARLAISAGIDHVRGALAFWALERDPAAWVAVLSPGRRLVA